MSQRPRVPDERDGRDRTQEATLTVSAQDALRGVLAFSITPFRNDDSIDIPRLEAHVDYLARAGLRAIVIAGNTGEFYTMSAAEVELAAAAAVRAMAGRGAVIVGVGHSVGEAAQGARTAEAVGAYASMVHMPPHPYTSDAGYLAYVEAITRATSIGVIPYLRATSLARDTVLRVVELDRVVAVKYARPDPIELATLIALSRDVADVAWLCGIAERWAPFFWTAGAIGVTSGIVNVEAAPSLELWRRLETGDRAGAMRIWSAIAPIEALRARHNDGANVAVLKEALSLLDRPVGHVRPPSSGLDEATRLDLPGALETLLAAVPVGAAMR
jgi:4-hydroxy-tetrahydrodipicolinate synthase